MVSLVPCLVFGPATPPHTAVPFWSQLPLRPLLFLANPLGFLEGRWPGFTWCPRPRLPGPADHPYYSGQDRRRGSVPGENKQIYIYFFGSGKQSYELIFPKLYHNSSASLTPFLNLKDISVLPSLFRFDVHLSYWVNLLPFPVVLVHRLLRRLALPDFLFPVRQSQG